MSKGRYSQDVKNQAVKLWLQGVPIEVISREHFNGYPTKQTLWAWYHTENWIGKKELAKKKADEILDTDLTDVIVKQKKMIRGLLAKGLPATIENLEAKGLSSAEILGLLKHELLLSGEVTDRKEVKSDLLEELREALS